MLIIHHCSLGGKFRRKIIVPNLVHTGIKLYKRPYLLKHAIIFFFSDIIKYDIMNEEPARFFEKIIRIQIIVKILYPFI